MDQPKGNGVPKHHDISLMCEDWLFLVEEDAPVLASCCEFGLNVDYYWRKDIAKGLRGKKVILVFRAVGDEKVEEYEAFQMCQQAGAVTRIWKPYNLGDITTPTLRDVSKTHSLAELLFWDKPWEQGPPAPRPLKRAGWPCTDLGNAERMANRHGSFLRYCRPWRKWLIWNGQRWEPDDLGRVEVMAKSTMRKIPEEAAAAFNQADRESILKWAIKCEAAGKINSMLHLVWSEPKIPILPSALDSNPWLLNCPNGTVDLRIGTLSQHDRSDLITRTVTVDFDPQAKCGLWDRIMTQIFAGNAELIAFIQQIFGMALTGDVSEQVLPIFHGAGANGKSTILSALLEIMGPDYGIMAPPGLLFQRAGDSHPTERAALFGKRLVVDMESAEGGRLNEALVKQLTGSDRIEARRMREDFWSFLPTHKIIMCTNHKPEIRETKNAIWRRVKLVPFTVEIPDDQQIKDLSIRLRPEFPGILAWCIRGCLDWHANGLSSPLAVESATQEYRSEQDTLAWFIAEECTVLPTLTVKASALYESYRRCTEGNGRVPATRDAWGSAMTERGFKRYSNNGTWYRGIGLRSSGQNPVF